MMVNLAEILKGNRWAVETSTPHAPCLILRLQLACVMPVCSAMGAGPGLGCRGAY